VAVLVATYGRPDVLAGCVASIVADLGPGDEVVVADAGGGGPLPGARLLPVDRPGKCHQLNEAVAATDHALLLFTDDDCRVAPGWIDAMAEPFSDPDVGIAFGAVHGLTHAPGDGPPPGPPPGRAPELTWTFAHGAAMGVRRAALEAAGGFDERLGPGTPAAGEDHDLLLRIREAGWAVAVAAAPAVAHLEWRDEPASMRNALAYERGAGAFLGAALRRHPRRGATLLKHRLGYQAALFGRQPDRPRTFGVRALVAFTGGVVYGVRLGPGRHR
jgi:GT2 family glycosyltransferase